MSDMVCRKSMMRCQTPGMCSPHGGCRDEVTTAKDRQISALIAENERLTNRLEVDPRHDYDGISTRDATVKVLDEQVDQLKAENERLEVEVKRMTSIAYAAHGAFRMETMAERDQLRAEVAGLRTGYEAYEQVNAELKADIDRLNDEYDKAWRHDLNDKKNVQALAAEVLRLSAESEALRKALADILDLYDTDEGCRNLPQYIVGRAALGQGEQS